MLNIDRCDGAVIIADDWVVCASGVDTVVVALDVMVDEYFDIGSTEVDFAESAVVVITEVGCDVWLSTIDLGEVVVLVIFDGGSASGPI